MDHPVPDTRPESREDIESSMTSGFSGLARYIKEMMESNPENIQIQHLSLQINQLKGLFEQFRIKNRVFDECVMNESFGDTHELIKPPDLILSHPQHWTLVNERNLEFSQNIATGTKSMEKKNTR